MKIKVIRKIKPKVKLAPLTAFEIQKLKEYEKEMGVILVAYRKEEKIPGQG